MSVTATSLEALFIQSVITMVAGCASFRTLVGAVSAAAAKAFIIELDGGDETELSDGAGHMYATDNSIINRGTAAGWAHVCDRPIDHTSERHAWLTWTHGAEIPVTFWWKRTASDKPAERRRRALNLLGTIRAEIEAQCGAADCLLECTITVRLDAAPDDAGWARDFDKGTLLINWRSLP